MAKITTQVGGADKPLKKIAAMIGGVWKDAKKLFIMRNGAWVEIPIVADRAYTADTNMTVNGVNFGATSGYGYDATQQGQIDDNLLYANGRTYILKQFFIFYSPTYSKYMTLQYCYKQEAPNINVELEVLRGKTVTLTSATNESKTFVLNAENTIVPNDVNDFLLRNIGRKVRLFISK